MIVVMWKFTIHIVIPSTAIGICSWNAKLISDCSKPIHGGGEIVWKSNAFIQFYSACWWFFVLSYVYLLVNKFIFVLDTKGGLNTEIWIRSPRTKLMNILFSSTTESQIWQWSASKNWKPLSVKIHECSSSWSWKFLQFFLPVQSRARGNRIESCWSATILGLC